MAEAYVQQVTAQTGSAANSLQTGAFAATIPAGDTILITVFGEISTTPTTVAITDTAGNAYTCDILNAYNSGASNVISNPGSNNVPAGVSWVGKWRAYNASSAGSLKVTVTLGGAVTGLLAIVANDYSGVAFSPVDVTANSAGASGSPSTGSLTTGYPADLIEVATAGTGGGSTPTFTVPAGFSVSTTNAAISSPIAGSVAYEIVGALQSSVNPTWSVTNFTQWVSAAVAYKADLIVQTTASAAASNVTTLSTSSFAAAVTTGNTVIVTLIGLMGTTSETIAISDSEGNTYTCRQFDCNGTSGTSNNPITNPATTNVPDLSDFVGIWESANVTGGSGFTVSATIGGSKTAGMTLVAAEFMNLGSSATIDTTKNAYTASGGSYGPGSFSTSNAHDVIVLGFCGLPSSGVTVAAPSGFSSLSSKTGTSPAYAGASCYQVVNATQSGASPDFTTTHLTDAVAIAVAYEASSGGPPTPTGLAVVGDATNPTTALDVSWTASAGATSYTLLRSAAIGGTFTTLASGITGTTYTDSGLTPGTEYAYEVEAVSGGGTSAASSAVAYATASAPPSALTATVISANEIDLSWTIPTLGSTLRLATPGNGYSVRMETPVGAANWSHVYTGNTAAFAGTGLTPGTPYGFEVSCEIEANNGDFLGGPTSAYSSEASGVTPFLPQPRIVFQPIGNFTR
jgi:hypothetical protein